MQPDWGPHDDGWREADPRLPEWVWVQVTGALAHCAGGYALLPVEVNDQPVWERCEEPDPADLAGVDENPEGLARWLFSTPNGYWRVTDDPADFESGRGYIISAAPHDGTAPHRVGRWATMLGDDPSLTVREWGGPRGAEGFAGDAGGGGDGGCRVLLRRHAALPLGLACAPADVLDPDRPGALLRDVVPGSVAERAGLQQLVGWHVVRAAGRRVRTPEDVQAAVAGVGDVELYLVPGESFLTAWVDEEEGEDDETDAGWGSAAADAGRSAPAPRDAGGAGYDDDGAGWTGEPPPRRSGDRAVEQLFVSKPAGEPLGLRVDAGGYISGFAPRGPAARHGAAAVKGYELLWVRDAVGGEVPVATQRDVDIAATPLRELWLGVAAPAPAREPPPPRWLRTAPRCGVVRVDVPREGGPLGCRLDPHSLELLEVGGKTPADYAGLSRLVGWSLAYFNGEAVCDSADVASMWGALPPLASCELVLEERRREPHFVHHYPKGGSASAFAGMYGVGSRQWQRAPSGDPPASYASWLRLRGPQRDAAMRAGRWAGPARGDGTMRRAALPGAMNLRAALGRPRGAASPPPDPDEAAYAEDFAPIESAPPPQMWESRQPPRFLGPQKS